MKRVFQVAAGLALAFGVCPEAPAQRHPRRMAPVVVSAPAGTRIVRAGQPQGVVPVTDGSGGIVVGGVGRDSVETLLNGNFPVPGLGFDFTHHTAINRNLGVRALIDPVTQHRLALARQIRRETPAFPVGFSSPVVFNSINIIIVPQPPLVILQQAVEEPAEPLERVRYVEREPEARSVEPPAPVRELGELVLVRRDGTLVFAVGFSTGAGKLVYITREGVRRSFPLAELDAEATRLMNEERGTSLRLPA